MWVNIVDLSFALYVIITSWSLWYAVNLQIVGLIAWALRLGWWCIMLVSLIVCYVLCECLGYFKGVVIIL